MKVNLIKFVNRGLEREVVIWWWRGLLLRLGLSLVHGADRGLVIGGLNGLGIRLESWFSTRLERRLFSRRERRFGRLLVNLSIAEELERFDDNIGCVAFLAILVIPRAVGKGSFDEEGHALSIEEKPENPKSNYAVTGLYFYPGDVSRRANGVKPSARGELEITTLNEMYLEDGLLDVKLLGRGFAWLDTGTMDSLLEAAEFVQMIEKRQGIKISAPEEIAYAYGWITKEELLRSAEAYGKSPYGLHLKAVADGKLKYSKLKRNDK